MNRAIKQLICLIMVIGNAVYAKRVVQASAYFLQKKVEQKDVDKSDQQKEKVTNKAQEVTSEPLEVLLQDTSFAHEVGDVVVADDGTTIFAFTSDPAKEWGICFTKVLQDDFSAYVHGETIFVNNEEQKEHPLEKHVVKHLTLIQKQSLMEGIDAKPLVVLDDGSLYLFTRKNSAYKLDHLFDALEKKTTNVIALQGTHRERAYVAVAPEGKKWGDKGSGICVVGTTEVEYKQMLENGEEAVQKKVCLTCLLDVTSFYRHSSAIKINKLVKSIGDKVIFEFCDELQRLYIGCNKVVVGFQDNCGARSVALGHHREYEKKIDDEADDNKTITVRENNLTVDSIFHHDLDLTLLGNNHVIATTQKDDVLSVHDLATITASTNRDYLIVRGGHGKPEDTTNYVYALPVVPQKDGCGLIADKDNHMVAAITAQQVSTADDAAVCVGGKPFDFGVVSHMFVRNDAVFICVTDAGNKNGVFSSQALFNAAGDVKGWASWQRVCLTSDKIYAATINPENSSLVYFTYDDKDQRTVVKETKWGDGDKELSSSLVNYANELFAETPAGIVDCAYMTQNDGAVMLLTGSRKVACIDEVSCFGGNEPVGLVFDEQNFKDIAPLSCSAMVMHDDTSTLFVAGCRGLMKYDDKEFVPVGEYKDVRQLVVDSNSLYVVSSTEIDRIDLDKDKNTTITPIARPQDFSERFLYCRQLAVVQSTLLVGTSDGLFFSSNNTWHRVALPEGERNVRHLFYVSSAPEHDVGGNLYVLTSSISTDRAFMHRLSVDVVHDGELKHTTLSLLHDAFIEGLTSYFVNFGRCKDAFVTDGATTWVTNQQNHKVKASLSAASGHYFPMRGRRNFGKRLRKVLEKDEIVRISRILKSTVTGSWLVTGNFGMHVCE